MAKNREADEIDFIPEDERNDERGDRRVNSLRRGSKGTGLVTFFFTFFFLFLFYHEEGSSIQTQHGFTQKSRGL